MKKNIFIILFLILVSGSAFSQNSGTGVGIILGEPTGISLKHWLSAKNALDAGLAWSFLNNGNVQIHGDYLFHFDPFSNSQIPAYIGVGGRIKLKNNSKKETDSRIGVRVPIGLDIHFPEPHLGVFIEVVPVLDLSPKTDMSFNAAIGIRYFFNN